MSQNYSVGHSYGGEVITNAGYNNPNVTGLVYIAAFTPDEGQSLSSFVDPSKFPKELFLLDSGGFILPKSSDFQRKLCSRRYPR
jgi:pimeloyl-ACP methyl ester carboxylesterase